MKKIAGIAATLAMATAFCGLCSGIAANVNAEAETSSAPTVSTSAVGTAPKVILCAGRSYSSSVTYSLSGDKVTKLSATEEGQYFVENAWFANYSVGEELPTPTTNRTGVSFGGWRYAVGGETKVVETMPAVSDDLFLYAHWTAGDNGSNPTIPDNPDIPDIPDNPGTRPSRVAVTAGNCYLVGQLSGESSFTNDTGILCTNDDANKPSGASHQYKITIELKVGEIVKFYYKKASGEANDAWAGWLENNNGAFGSSLINEGGDNNIKVLTAGTYTFYIKVYTNDGGGSVWVEQ